MTTMAMQTQCPHCGELLEVTIVPGDGGVPPTVAVGFTKNVKTDYGATGDGQHATVTATTNGTTLVVGSSIFSPGDVDKVIQISGAGNGYDDHITTIASITNPTTIVLTDIPPTALSGTSQDIWWATNDNAAFRAFQKDAIADGGLCTLNVPLGIYCWGCIAGTPTGGWNSQDDIHWMAAPHVEIVGIGNPTLFGTTAFGVPFAYPCNGDNGLFTAAKIAEARPGDTTIRLLNLDDVPIFTPGRSGTYHTGDSYEYQGTILLNAYDLQGFGNPPNPFYWEVVQAASIDEETGIITLITPLQDGPYLTTYPDFDGTEPNTVGSATAVAMNVSWDSDMTLDGFTIRGPGGGAGSGGRAITIKNCTFLGDYFPNPSVCETFTIDNTTFSGTEPDKIVGTLNVRNNCYGNLTFQSASIKNVNVTDCGSGINVIGGTPRHITITNCDIAHLNIGSAYGRTETFTATNCALGTTNFTTTGGLTTIDSSWSLSNGVITGPGTVGGLQRGMPGTHVIFQKTYNYQGMFQVLGSTQPGGLNTNQFTQTNITGLSSFPPTIDDPGGGPWLMMTHPCESIRVTNCTGPQCILNASRPGAFGRPIYSYAFYDYDETTGAFPAFEIWGKLIAIKFNVLTAYSGSVNPAKLHIAFNGGNYPIFTNTGTKHLYDPVIDVRTPGLRTIMPSGVTGSTGLDRGLTWPDATAMFSGPLSPGMGGGGSLSGSPFHFTLEIITDQGIAAKAQP